MLVASPLAAPFPSAPCGPSHRGRVEDGPTSAAVRGDLHDIRGLDLFRPCRSAPTIDPPFRFAPLIPGGLAGSPRAPARGSQDGTLPAATPTDLASEGSKSPSSARPPPRRQARRGRAVVSSERIRGPRRKGVDGGPLQHVRPTQGPTLTNSRSFAPLSQEA